MIAFTFKRERKQTLHSYLNGRTVVYVIQGTWGGLVKIGVASRAYSRLITYDRNTAYGIRIIAIKDGDEYYETSLHRRFRHWLAWRTEWYLPNPEIDEFLKVDPGWDIISEMVMSPVPVLPPFLQSEFDDIERKNKRASEDA